MFKNLFIVFCLMLQSCVALSQEDLTFIDLTEFAPDMPEFELVDMRTGDMYSSAVHDGAAFVLEMYFNGCSYCNKNAPNVKKLVREFEGNPKVQILEVSIDCDEAQYTHWIRKHSPEGPVLNDCDGAVNDVLGVRSYPTTVVFYPNGRQAMRSTGVWSGSTYNKIKSFLKEKSKG